VNGIKQGGIVMNARKLRQKEKKRQALNEERMAGRVSGLSDPTVRIALKNINKRPF
jgi:hypothetical protein